jgi:transcription elongation factor Elf1
MVFEMVGACPRCGKDTSVEIGESLLKIGKTREQPIRIASCGNCGLIFYEMIDKIKEF